ncbi:MAG: hypothetical protein ACNS63_13165 [Candidatus Nitrospinota bacterium M3_3B_026]
MLVAKLKSFINTFTFEDLMYWIENVSPLDLLTSPWVIVPVVLIIGLIAYPHTSYFGQQLVLYLPAAIYLFITFVILKNGSISDLGPFIMAMIAFFIIVGWLIWTRLLKD